MNKSKLHAIPSVYYFFIVVDHWGFIAMATKVGVAMLVGFGRYLLKVLVGRSMVDEISTFKFTGE